MFRLPREAFPMGRQRAPDSPTVRQVELCLLAHLLGAWGTALLQSTLVCVSVGIGVNLCSQVCFLQAGTCVIHCAILRTRHRAGSMVKCSQLVG